ncbi:N-(5'-phosphoribosyl)anthranilate isomerase [Bythopirellula goksoeyrii]|uniref:N-(5'-phosphoribosyl)anthranilate isomerase n=2 Tax=Bythopirellula goksoeyrii TaxID=1400387 RepID=A0A5B9QBE1_9BACT|nr:N-(5'-phosphoribosyl)anthranilate isomerase [Bythopirellula goksoeyrii]
MGGYNASPGEREASINLAGQGYSRTSIGNPRRLAPLRRLETRLLDLTIFSRTMHNPQCLAETHLRADQVMLRIKICGITSTADARAAVEAGADAIGLNFYRGSKRYVTPEKAQDIVSDLAASVAKVGVFVNSSVSEVNQIAQSVGLDWVQLHGDEPPEFLSQVSSEKHILRVYRLESSELTPVTTDLAACQVSGRMPDAILVDSVVPGEYGGTGKKGSVIHFKRDRIRSQDLLFSMPVLLAGGLTPENVGEAIRDSCPEGVDVASGVESSPGVKDPELVKRFVAEAQYALEQLKR